MTLPEETPQQPTPEEGFRSSLDDMVVVLKKISPLCTSIDSLIELVELAIKNDSQLNLLMNLVMPVRMKR